ncbi:MAG: SUMF1/EgtB/PvdO family nonheme iron enzyme [Phycisphaerae bacterium]|jgi:formylglycine-generating enzyme required for sulfatase activity
MVIGIVAALLVSGASGVHAQTHAPWPSDWNNWSDPNLWVTVGDPGNAGAWSGASYSAYGAERTFGPDRICGAVAYAFSMGKFEVTAGQYTAFLNAVARTDTFGLYSPYMADPTGYWGCNIQQSGSPGSYTYSVDPEWANRPVNYVSWGDAARFANWLTHGQPAGPQDANTTEDGSYLLNGATSYEALMAVTRKTAAQGGRYYIPTEDEWYKAAYYKGGGLNAGYRSFSTGNNSSLSNDLSNPDGNNNANFYQGGYTLGSPYYRTEAGDFENSQSPYGTFDQGGNVWEWNETILCPSCRGLRGGSFDRYDDYLHASHRSGDNPTNEDFNIGFRLSKNLSQ